ncbi:MAG: hypothetical protein AAF108_09060 [Planctomycetota bacterium]
MKRVHRRVHLVAWCVLPPALLAMLVWAVFERPDEGSFAASAAEAGQEASDGR